MSGNDTRVGGWGGWPARWSASFVTAVAVGVGGLALWYGHPACRCRALCMHRATATPSSKCIFHRHYICPSVPTQNKRDRLAGQGGGCRTYPPISRSQSRTSVNDTHPWKLYTPPGMCGVRRLCGDVMYVCHSKCRTDRDNAVRPLTLKPKLHVYDLFSTCWCAVFDLVFVQNGERRRFG